MSTSRATPRLASGGEPDFPAWLAGLPDDALVSLCVRRPDVANPPPASLDVLASRLRLPASTARAMGTLTWPELLVLATAADLGANSGPVPLRAVSGRLAVDDDDPAFRAAVHTLRELALLWGDESHARIVPVTGAAVDAAPVTAPRPGEPVGADLDTTWSGLSARALGVLEAIARGRSPVGALGSGASETVRAAATELADAGLAEITGADGGEVVVPRAHALDRARHGARPAGGSLLDTPTWAAPIPATARSTPARTTAPSSADTRADASGGVAALDLLHRCDAVLAALSVLPAATLKAGGVGVRELRRVSRAAGLDPHELPLLLEVLAAAGLLAVGDADIGDTAFDSVWAPTEAADVWSAREPQRRWAELALAWWSMPRAPWRVGAEIEGGGTVPALGDLVGPPAQAERSRVLGALARLDPASEPGDVMLPEVVRWFSPVWFSRAGARPGTETVLEARRLGLVVGTTATSAARLLAVGTASASGAPGVDELEPILTAALPDPVSEVIVQADLTILAPGPLMPELAAEFAQLADVESAGAAVTYRVTENSLRRALDSGSTAAGIRDLLARTSITPVPQSLDYLIEDVARRHGRLRVGSALSFLRCDDPSLVAQVMGSAVAESCALRSVAPTVLISQARPLDLVESLREHGFAPVVEDTSGAVVALSRPVARVRATSPSRAPRVPTRAATPTELRAAITAMRSADRVRSARGAAGSGYTGEAAIARLHEAAGTGSAVTVSVVDAEGRSTSRLIIPSTVTGGRIEGIEPDSTEPVTLPLHRVISVADLDPTR